MKRLRLICCITVLTLISLSCTAEPTLEFSENEIDDGIVIENVGSVDCLVPVRLGAGEQQFELTANETVTVTDVSQPIEVSAVSVQDE